MSYIFGMRTAAEDLEISRQASERYFQLQEMAARKAEGRSSGKDLSPITWVWSWTALVRRLSWHRPA